MVYYANQRVHYRPLAEEIASGAFYKIWRRHRQFTRLSGIKAYLIKIVERDCQKALAKERKVTTLKDHLPNEAADHSDAFRAMVKSETYTLLYHAIEKLSPGMQAVIKSLYIEGNSLTQTAQLLNLNTSTVDTQKKRAVKALAKLLPRLGVVVPLLCNCVIACRI